jgi:hypothetical protein
MPVHPELTKYATKISSKAKYPIKTFAALMKALGGENARITFEGPRGTVKGLRKVIPAEFFPVESEKDLLKKSEKLRAKYMKK